MLSPVCLTGYGYRAEIWPERGANMISLTKGNMRSVRTPSSLNDFAEQDPYLWGVPILLPPNRISGAAFEFEGRTYRLPMNEPKLNNFIHGLFHASPLACSRQTEQEAEFIFEADESHPYMGFPHAFSLRILFSLREDGMHQQVRVRNNSALNMPFALGFHTTFALPLTEGGRPEDIRMALDVEEEIVRNMENYLPTGETVASSPLSEALNNGTLCPTELFISRHFAMGKKHELALTDAAQGVRLRYRASEAYRYWMIYNGGRKDLICVEPQTWINNCPNAPFDRAKTGFTVLCPGEEKQFETVFTLETL